MFNYKNEKMKNKLISSLFIISGILLITSCATTNSSFSKRKYLDKQWVFKKKSKNNPVVEIAQTKDTKHNFKSDDNENYLINTNEKIEISPLKEDKKYFNSFLKTVYS